MTRIYCWINTYAPYGYVSMAVAEDGTFLGSHLSSTPEWSKYDIGCNDNPKHPRRVEYAERYPDGYELEWIERDDVMAHEGLTAAFAANELKERYG